MKRLFVVTLIEASLSLLSASVFAQKANEWRGDV